MVLNVQMSQKWVVLTQQEKQPVGALPGDENITVSERIMIECLPCTGIDGPLYGRQVYSRVVSL